MMENNLPKGWVIISLEELCNMIYGKGLLTKYLTETGYPVYGANGVIGKYNKYLYEDSQVIISCRGAASGAIHKTVSKSFITSNSIVLQLNSKEINLDYFKYSLLSVDRNRIVTGSAQPQITIENLNSLNIPISPLPEQNRIVSKLGSLMEKIEKNKQRLEKIPTLLKRFRQSVLSAAVNGILTSEWRENNSIVQGWDSKNIGELIESSFYGPRFSKDDYVKDGIPTLRTTDFNSKGQIELNEPPRIRLTQSQIEKYKVLKDDILITRTGSIGTLAIFKGDYIAIPSAYLIRFRIKKTVFADFLFYYFLSPYGQELLGINSTSVTQANVNAEKIKEIKIDVPSIGEQQEIVRRVEQLFSFADKIESRYNKAKAMLDKLPQSILAKAFRGELVPQDENDEPASVLLERIKAEKAKLSDQKKPKKTKPSSQKESLISKVAEKSAKYKTHK